jgi:hypothetical protein
MMLRLLSIFSLLLWFSLSNVAAQDSARIAIKGGPQIYVDYGKLLLFPTDFESKFEFGVAYQFKFKFQPNFQYGQGSVKPASAIENGTYLSEGSYWRAGLNYLIPFDATNSFYLGVKYSQAKYEDSGTYTVESDVWPTLNESFERKDLEADWFEVLIGSEKAYKKGHIRLGGMFGLRFINKRKKIDFIDTYAVPGYGRTLDKLVPFLNVYVKYQF